MYQYSMIFLNILKNMCANYDEFKIPMINFLQSFI